MSGKIHRGRDRLLIKLKETDAVSWEKIAECFPELKSRNAAGALLYEIKSPRSHAEETAEEEKENIVIHKKTLIEGDEEIPSHPASCCLQRSTETHSSIFHRTGIPAIIFQSIRSTSSTQQ